MSDKKVTDEEYLKKHKIQEFLKDAVKLLCETRDEKPLQFLAVYFANVINGENILFRDFDYVNLTSENRKSFMRIFMYVYRHYENDKKIDVYSFHQLLTLLCPAFPLSYVENGKQILGLDSTPCFSKLANATFMLFFYSEFVFEASELFRKNLKGENRICGTKEFLDQICKLIQERSDNINCPLEGEVMKRAQNLGTNTSFIKFCQCLFTSDHPLPSMECGDLYESQKYGIRALLQNTMMDKKSTDSPNPF